MNACTLHNLEILHNATDGRFEVRLRLCGAFETLLTAETAIQRPSSSLPQISSFCCCRAPYFGSWTARRRRLGAACFAAG